MDNSILNVLNALHPMRRLAPEAGESRLEKIFKRPAKYFLWASIATFFVLLLLVAWVWLMKSKSDYWLVAAKVLLAILFAFVVAWTLADTLPSVIMLFFFRRDFHERRKLEVIHDLQNAHQLHEFDAIALRITDKWIALRADRMQRRLGLIVGGSDKVAAIALLAGAWGLWANFPGSATSWQQNMYVAFSALIGAFGAGGILGSVVVDDLAYQRDILALALSVRNASE